MKAGKPKRWSRKRPIQITTVSALLVLLVAGIFIWQEQSATAPYNPTQPTQKPTHEQPATSTAPAQPRPQTFNKTSYSTSDPSSPWVVVNKRNPLQPLSYIPPDLVSVGGSQLMRSESASALSQLLQAAGQAGQPMSVLSAYRSYATQSAVYNSYVRSDGQATADTYSARPGYSEHQTGLAVDVGNGTCNLLACFGDTTAGMWLADNAHSHGFIIRYPKGKSAITGYQYEPWHLRYVGKSLATEMHNKSIMTLEEFFGVAGGTSY